uniref:Kinesin-like protein n=1 Tax=Alexandrium monilatum TaxID=311494 RepID=A0A7S4SS63_9DINO
MLGPEGGRRQDSMAGVLPRAATELFRRIAQLEADAERTIGARGFSGFEVRASFIEVYCENAFDLLGGSVSASRDAAGACQIREQTDPPRVYAEGAKEERVASTVRLLELVARGAANRTTAATGVHAHSSRSHALLVLSVEHRWRSLDDPQQGRFLSRVSRLTLVDLAGSETMERSHAGNVDAAGVGTNLGLLVLGRVIQALAEGKRVPYRDSMLTRLLQTSLGGSAKTQMLACVSPAAVDAEQTFRTLQYATGARDVRVTPEVARVREEFDTDPMLGDHDDEDAQLNRRAIWIETREFGDVFARCVGDPADPLILWVHGSGPSNSSMFWNEVIMDVARLMQANTRGLPAGFFHVAIDCPGYGRSPFDRQTIRSYPGQFLSAVVEALGRRSAAAMCGSSQGCASVFNAALECPRLMHALAVCHPVGHAPQRYTSISQPTLLIFDTEDDGHPVSVGRQMRRYLPNNRYFEFARSVDGNWEAAHMGEELVALLAGSWHEIKGKRRGGRPDPKLPELVRVAGGFRAWNEQHGQEWAPMMASEPVQVAAPDADGAAGGPSQGPDQNAWRAVLDPASNMLQYQHVESGRISNIRPPGARILVERLDISAGEGQARSSRARCRSPSRASAEPLFEERDEESEDEDARREREEREAREAAEVLEREAAQVSCDLCGGLLIEPVRLNRCRCAFCGCCVELTVRYTRQCPKCGDKVEVKDGRPASDAQELAARTAARETAAEGSDAVGFQQQRARANELASRSAGACRMVLEYGNTSERAGGKTNYVTFLKVPLLEGFPKVAKAPIAKVDFNINPGFGKPTASVSNPDAKAGAKFEYAMARSYPCFVTVHFAKELGLPLISIQYVVQDLRTVSRRIIVQFPRGGLSDRRPGEVTFDAGPPRNGWIQCASGGAHAVQYLPEGQGAAQEEGPRPKAKAKGKGKAKAKARAQASSPVSSSNSRTPSRCPSRQKASPRTLPKGSPDAGTSAGSGSSEQTASAAESRGPAEMQMVLQQAESSGDVALSISQLESLLPGMSPEEVRLLLDATSTAEDDKVDFRSLCSFAFNVPAGEGGTGQPALSRQTSDNAKRILRDRDPDGDGLLSAAKLQELLPQMTRDEVRVLLNAVGEQEGGAIEYDRLCDFVYGGGS